MFNACFAIFSPGLGSAAVFRFLVGICLAGIYPIGMKLIVSWAPERTGSALAYLVGMLTLGTALPQGLRFLGGSWRWQAVILSSSGLGLLAAALIFFLGMDLTSPCVQQAVAGAWGVFCPRSRRHIFVPQLLATSDTCGNSIASGRWHLRFLVQL